MRRHAARLTPDAQLLQQWRSGDRRAGHELLERYFTRVWAYVSRYASDESEDLVQEVFSRLVSGIHHYRAETSFASYVFGIALNVVREHVRRSTRIKATYAFDDEDFFVDVGDSPEQVVAELEQQLGLSFALDSLPQEDRDLLELHYWHQLRKSELAEVFSLPESTVRSRLRAARQRLRRAYDQQDAPLSELDLELARRRRLA